MKWSTLKCLFRYNVGLIILLLTVTPVKIPAQTVQGKSLAEFIANLKKVKSDSASVLLLLAEGESYRLRVGSFQSDIDTAMLFASRAKAISEKINFFEGYRKSVILEINALLEEENIPEIKKRLASMKQDEVLANAWLVLGEYYLEKGGTLKKDMDSAFYCFTTARAIAASIGSARFLKECLARFGRFYFEKNEISKGRMSFLEAIYGLQKEGLKEEEAGFWMDYGYYLPDRDSLFDEKVGCITKCIELFHALGNGERELWALKTRAEIIRRQGKLEVAEHESLNILDIQKQIKAADIYSTYNILSEIEIFRGDFSKALEYAFASIDAMTTSHDTIFAGIVYEKLGNIYGEMNNPAKSIDWLKKSLNIYTKGHDHEACARINALIASQLVNAGGAIEALALLREEEMNYLPSDPIIREFTLSVKGAAYSALKDYEKAQRFYNEMIRLERMIRTGNQNSANAYYKIGKFYLENKKYALAKLYLDTALIISPGRVPASKVRDIHFMLFRVDSSLGKYNLAIHHLQAFHILNDSISNDRKIRQIEKIQTQYEINQKEKDIELLKKQGLIQQQEIKQSSTVKKFSLAGLIMLMVVLTLGYNRYRLKQKSTRQLIIQQNEISAKNKSLQQLVQDKEWLAREVHHRVKNNLQIIISLLNEQQEYLDNEVAIQAVNESRNRLHAISMIHQKLYSPNGPQTIEMRNYVRDFIGYLKESLSGTQKIFFDISIEPVKLNVGQAVPVGLIINEAVTNAIKYAFPVHNEKGNRIEIYLRRTDKNNQFVLMVADNGIGLPLEIDFEKRNSLGIKLIKTFSEQLEGELKIIRLNGLRLELTFFKAVNDKAIEI